MPKSRREKNPSPARHPVLRYSTPDVDDVVFYIQVDSTLKAWKTPVYGESYNSKDGEYANHKLVHVTSADGNGWVKWYYAADRSDQGAYNFEYKEPSATQGGFPSYTRTYFIKREDVKEYFPEDDGEGGSLHIAAGAPDPDKSFNPEFVDFLFTGQDIVRVEDQDLDSLYVLLVRKFEKFCTKTSYVLNPLTGDLDQTTSKVILSSDADETTGIDENGQYTVTNSMNCDFSEEVSKKDANASMLDQPLEGQVYDSGSCQMIDTSSTIVDAGTGGTAPTSTTEEVDGVDVTTSTGVYTEVSPINKLFSRAVTKVDNYWSILSETLTRKLFTKGNASIVDVGEKIVKKVDASGSSPVILNKGTASASSTGVYTEVVPLNKCLSKEVDKVDSDYSMLNVEQEQKLFNKGKATIVTKGTTIVEAGASGSVPVISGSGASASSTGVYTEVTPINDDIARATEKVDSDYSMLNVGLEGHLYNGTVGASTPSSTTVVPISEVPSTDVNISSDKTVDDYIPINADLAKKTTRQVIPSCDRVNVGYDEVLGAGFTDTVTYTQTQPTPSSSSNGEVVTAQEIACGWWKKNTRSSMDTALSTYSLVYPSTSSISVPSVLKSVDVMWSKSKEEGDFKTDFEGYSTGTSYGLSGSESGSANSSASVVPSASLDIENGFSGSVPTEVHVFFAKTGQVESRCAALGSRWPLFKTQSHTIVVKAQSAAVSSRVSASARFSKSKSAETRSSTTGKGGSVSLRETYTTISIPATIHGQITIDGNERQQEVEAVAKVEWNGWGGFPTIKFSKKRIATAYGEISKKSLPATTPPSIPTSGDYVLNTRISPYKGDWVKVACEVFNASSLS